MAIKPQAENEEFFDGNKAWLVHNFERMTPEDRAGLLTLALRLRNHDPKAERLVTRWEAGYITRGQLFAALRPAGKKVEVEKSTSTMVEKPRHLTRIK